MWQKMLQVDSGGGSSFSKELVPQLSSSTTLENAKIISSTPSGSSFNYNAFDRNSATYFATASTESVPHIGYNFSRPTKVFFAKIMIGNYCAAKLQAEKNGNWIDISDIYSIRNSDFNIIEVNDDKIDKYNKYRILFTSLFEGSQYEVSRLQFLGE